MVWSERIGIVVEMREVNIIVELDFVFRRKVHTCTSETESSIDAIKTGSMNGVGRMYDTP